MCSKRAKILVVDDNPRVRSFVRPALQNAGFDCIEAEDGWIALEKVETEYPDLIVLDIFLGDDRMSGLDVCKKIRRKGLRTPVIFLTIKDRAEDPRWMERAFRTGADDYMSKREELRRLEQNMGLVPAEYLERKSDIEELVARIRARLHHTELELELEDFLRVSLARKRVEVKQEGQWQEVNLTATEFLILDVLIKNRGHPVGKEQLMDCANIDGEGSLQNHIWRLRYKIEQTPETPRYILTYHGIGYRFRDLGIRR